MFKEGGDMKKTFSILGVVFGIIIGVVALFLLFLGVVGLIWKIDAGSNNPFGPIGTVFALIYGGSGLVALIIAFVMLFYSIKYLKKNKKTVNEVAIESDKMQIDSVTGNAEELKPEKEIGKEEQQ